jgi:hypothetical protein
MRQVESSVEDETVERSQHLQSANSVENSIGKQGSVQTFFLFIQVYALNQVYAPTYTFSVITYRKKWN